MSFVYEDETKRWSPEAGGYVSKQTGALISKSPTYSDAAQKPSPTANPVTTSPLPTAVAAKGPSPVKPAPVSAPTPTPVPTQADHQAYINQTFPGGVQAYSQGQAQRYTQALTSGDTDLATRLKADAERVGYSLPQQQKPAQDPRIAILEAELNQLKEQQKVMPQQQYLPQQQDVLGQLQQKVTTPGQADDILTLLRQRVTQPQPIYDPKTDPAYQAVSKQLSDQVLEEMNRRGILNSTITAGQVTDVLASVLPQFQQQFYNLQQQQTGNLFDLAGAYSGQKQQQIGNLQGLTNIYSQLEQQTYARNLETQNRQIAEEKRKIENAWERVKNLGYVDNIASIALGIPVGTLSAEVQKTIDDRIADLTKKQMDNETEMAKANIQAETEKAKLDETVRYHDAQIGEMIAKTDQVEWENEFKLYKQNIDEAVKRTETFGEVQPGDDKIIGVPVGTPTQEAKKTAETAKATADYRSKLLKIQEGNAKKLTPRQQAEQRILNGEGTPEDFKLIGITDDTPISKIRQEATRLAQQDMGWPRLKTVEEKEALVNQYVSLLTQKPATTNQANQPMQISNVFAPSPVENVLSGRAPAVESQIPEAGDEVRQMIDTARGNGYSDEQIRQALIEDGISPDTYGL